MLTSLHPLAPNLVIPAPGAAFDPWLACNHPGVLTIGDTILAGWSTGIDRQRARALKAGDRQNREAMLRSILANLALAVAAAQGGTIVPSIGIGLRAAKQPATRYDRPAFRGLPGVIDLMAGTGLLSLQRSRSMGTVSTVVPSVAVIAALRRCGVCASDLTQQPGRETVILSRNLPGEAAWRKSRKDRVHYRDTATSHHFRAEMEKINRFLAAARMAFVDDDGPVVWPHARSLRRYFVADASTTPSRPRFDLGGRLYGGGATPAWWSDLPKARRKGIRLQGEPIADLDFSSMFVRLAYIEAGLSPPADADLYAGVQGVSDARWRPGVKKVVSAMLFRSEPLLRPPNGAAEHLPPGMSGAGIRAAILARHPALAGVFETGIGMRLMFVESQVIVAAMLRFVEAGIAALPMHDGVMVPRSKVDHAKRIMTDAALAVTGHALPISWKAI